jgi:hypothetical protein
MRHLYSSSLALSAWIAASGCSTDTPSDEPSKGVAVESASAAAPWYRGSRTIDLTGDAQADSIRLEAVGTRPDSLRITLSLVVDGQEKHREVWGSSYELALVDSVARVAPRVDQVLRAKLDSVLASVTVQRLDAPGVHLMAEDSAVLAGLVPRPTNRVSYSYGYETTVRLAWDAPRERFIRLWTCC